MVPLSSQSLFEVFSQLPPEILESLLKSEATSFDGIPFQNPFKSALLCPKPIVLNQTNHFVSFPKPNRAFDNIINPTFNLSKTSTNIKRMTASFNQDDYVQVQKKVKFENLVTNGRRDFGSETSLSLMGPSYPFIKPDYTYSTPSLIQKQYVSHISAKQGKKEHSKNTIKKITGAAIDKKNGCLLYKADCESDENIISSEYLTKAEILRKDPLALVYFYEQHLSLPESFGFNLKALVKLNIK